MIDSLVIAKYAWRNKKFLDSDDIKLTKLCKKLTPKGYDPIFVYGSVRDFCETLSNTNNGKVYFSFEIVADSVQTVLSQLGISTIKMCDTCYSLSLDIKKEA